MTTATKNIIQKLETLPESMVNEVADQFRKVSTYELDHAMSAWYNSYTCI